MRAACTKATGLDMLEARLAQDLAWLELPAKSWVPPRDVDGQRVRDVVIVGAGMAGLVASAMLKRLGVDNQVLFDRAPAGSEGPWVTHARMRTLRSPKQLTGPAMGLPALTFRAYYEARFGREAWDALDRAPRTLWMDYLVWYRRVLELPVENEVEVAAIEPRPDGLLALRIVRSGSEETVYARHVIVLPSNLGEQTVIEEQKLDIKASEPVYSANTYVLIHRSEANKLLGEDVNRALKELRDDGTMDKLSQKWFGEEIVKYMK